MDSRAVNVDFALYITRGDDLVGRFSKYSIVTDLLPVSFLLVSGGQKHTQEKIISDLLATSFTVSTGMAPSAFNDSPRERVLFVYNMDGADVEVKYFCRFLDMPMPIEPSPIHPTCVPAIFD